MVSKNNLHHYLVIIIKKNDKELVYKEIDKHFIPSNNNISSKDCDLILSFLSTESNNTEDIKKTNYNELFNSIINIYTLKNWSFTLSSYPLIIRILCNLGRYDEAIKYLKTMESLNIPIKTRTISSFFENNIYLERGHFDFLIEIFDKYNKIFTTDQYESLLVLFNNNYINPIVIEKLNKLLDFWCEIDYVLNSRLIDLFLKFEEKINNNFIISKVDFIKNTCSRCNQKLQKHSLMIQDRQILVNQLINVFQKNNVNDNKYLKKFQGWINDLIKTSFSRLIIIDGGNIGHSSNGIFSKEPIITLLNQLTKTFDNLNVTYLVILHQSRKKEFRDIIVKPNCLFYYTPYQENDDLYWMLTSFMIKDSLVITNDNLRDHHVDKLDETLFKRWKEDHLVTYTKSCIDNQFVLNYPLEYTIGVQKLIDNTYHLPVSQTDHIQWFCMKF